MPGMLANTRIIVLPVCIPREMACHKHIPDLPKKLLKELESASKKN